MILDYNYSKQKRQLSFSYINERGGKSILKYNVNRFKSFCPDPNGQFINWDGQRLTQKMTDRPEWTEFKTFIEELPPSDKKLLLSKIKPRLYTFDIEVKVDPKEFPEPGEAKFPILTISIVNENLDAIVLGIKQLDDPTNKLQSRYEEWLSTSEFYKKLNLPKPKVSYIYFETEEELLRYFLKNIVAKCPVMAGWNSLGFDWYYIQQRVKLYYPNISFNSCSIDWTMKCKNITSFKGDKIKLIMPNHTLVLDMMDVIGTFDMAVMPIKENLSLNYIATESIGMGKIQYEGDLQSLYENDYPTYVFYNLIDSVLVQLIDKRFKTLNILYTQSLICRNDISTAFSKIKIAESMFFNHFFENGIKVMPSEKFTGERGTLVGAYVRQTTPGKHMFVCCNDFSALYPSTGRVTNISFENYLGGTADGTFTESDLEKYRQDPNYFVSITGCVYKNDRDYALKLVWTNLAKLRNSTKYLAKRIAASVLKDLNHQAENRPIKDEEYSEDVRQYLKDHFGFDVSCWSEMQSKIENLQEMIRLVSLHVEQFFAEEQAYKLISNSIYGGLSHVANQFFNIYLANDITGEGRNLIHIMEKHIPQFFQDNWQKMTDLHKSLGIKLKANLSNPVIDQPLDEKFIKDTNIYAQPVAGDTDSIYFCYEGLLNTIDGIGNMSITEKAKIIERINLEFLNQHNKGIMLEYYKSRNIRNPETDMCHEFELETIAYSEIRLEVKKRYSQMLIWKDGLWYDEDHLKQKTKGLEMVKASYPAPARKILDGLVKTLLLSEDQHLIHVLNRQMQDGHDEWMATDVETISPSISVNNYTNYILSDNDPVRGVMTGKGCPFAVRGLAYYNWLRQTKGLIGDPLYGGKMKYYVVKTGQPKRRKTDNDTIFTFQPSALPKWADQYAPCDKDAMFSKCVLDPFNRILSAVGMKQLHIDGHIDVNLFDLF